jgi:uncharacterized protein YjbJ (UPF0337 family)
MSSNPAQNNNPYKSPEDPSLIGGHAQYVKGYVEETVGNVTGSKEWVDSGKKDTQEGIETMKVSYVNLHLRDLDAVRTVPCIAEGLLRVASTNV